MLNNKEVLEKFEEIISEISERNSNTDDYENYANEIEELIDNIANKTDLYKKLIRLWLDEEIELKQKDLKIRKFRLSKSTQNFGIHPECFPRWKDKGQESEGRVLHKKLTTREEESFIHEFL